MKRITSLLLALALLLSVALVGCAGTATGGSQSAVKEGASSKTTGGKKTSQYFKTPEAAAEYFIGCIREGDVEGALAAFPIDERVAAFDFVAFVEQQGGYVTPAYDLPPVDEYSYYYDFVRETVRRQMYSLIPYFVYALTDLAHNVSIQERITESDLPETGPDGWRYVVEAYDPSVIQGLTFQKLYALEDLDFDEGIYSEYADDLEGYKDDLKDAIQFYFGNTDPELAIYAVLCQSGEQNYLCAMRFLKFSDGWKLWNLETQLFGSLIYTQPIIPVTEEELSSLLKNAD